MKKQTLTESEDVLVLEYDLHSLPTAQHKAGLAGLLLMIESLQTREMGPVPECEVSPSKATIYMTLNALQTIFDDLYDAEWIEVESKNKWGREAPKRVVEVETEINGKTKIEKRYVYDIFSPKCKFLEVFYPHPSNDWIKLLKDTLWGTIRSIPATRLVYKERANDEASSLTSSIWKGLCKAQENKKKGKIHTEAVSSALFLGAQDINAEKVSFQGVPEENLLLHFWILPSLVFVPRTFSMDGKYENCGYVFTVPEPCDLVKFNEEIIKMLRSLEVEILGFRPKASLIDVPEEGGLEYVYSFVNNQTSQSDVCYTVSAVEIYHVEKKGNSVRFHDTKRIPIDQSLVNRYSKMRKQFRNPFYNSQRVRNLLNGHSWNYGMDRLFNEYPSEYFIPNEKTKRNLPFFGWDVRQTLNQIYEEIKLLQGENGMEDEKKDQELIDKELSIRIRGLIRSYVRKRSEDKSNMKYESFKENDKGWKVLPKDYKEAMAKVCMDAFLAMRSRRDQDFVEYFSGTICSVPQFLPEADYLSVTQALLRQTETVKTLSMLALSAESSMAISRDDQTQNKGDE